VGCVVLYSLKAVGCNVAILICDASGRVKHIGAEKKKTYRLTFRKCIIRVSAWIRTIVTEHCGVPQCVAANARMVAGLENGSLEANSVSVTSSNARQTETIQIK
jgi:hypothetical protein